MRLNSGIFIIDSVVVLHKYKHEIINSFNQYSSLLMLLICVIALDSV